MKVETELSKKLSNTSFSPTAESSESYPPQMFLNWSGAQSSSLSSVGYCPAILTCDNKQLQIQTINDEFLYLLDYQDELELIGKSVHELIGSSDNHNLLLEKTGEHFGSLKRKDGSLVFGFIKLRYRPKDVVIINFHQVPVEQCRFHLSCDLELSDFDNPQFFASAVNLYEKGAPESDGRLLLEQGFLPLFDASDEKPQFLTLRKSEGCWPVKLARTAASKNHYTIQTFPSIGGLLIVACEDLRIKSINHDFCLMLTGFTEQELVGKAMYVLLPNISECLKTMNWFPLTDAASSAASPSTSEPRREMFSTPKPFSLDLHHKDGGIIRVQAQCREFNSGKEERLLAVWIGYQRNEPSTAPENENNIFSPSLVLSRKKSYHDALSPLSPIPGKFPEIIKASLPHLSIQDFDEVKALGEGSFSFIKLCIHKLDPKRVPVVIKYVVRSRILTWSRDHQELGPRVPVELAVLHDLRKNPHTHIPALQAHFSDEFYYCLLFDYSPSAFDVFELLEKKRELTFGEIRNILNQTCSAIAHLHSIGIVHRDIKDENILIDSAGHVTLIDFGSAHYIEKGPFLTFYGTKLFCAPEILNGQPYEGRKQDVWQLGCLLFILVFKQNPFYTVEEILNGNITFPVPLEDRKLDNLFQLLLNLDETERGSVTDLMSHEWMKSA